MGVDTRGDEKTATGKNEPNSKKFFHEPIQSTVSLEAKRNRLDKYRGISNRPLLQVVGSNSPAMKNDNLGIFCGNERVDPSDGLDRLWIGLVRV